MAATRPDADPRWRETALVLCAHGIRGTPGTALEHAQLIRRLRLFKEVRACAHKGEPGLVDTMAEVAASRTWLLPLLMAEGYTLRAMLRKLEGVPSVGKPVVCRPVGTHPRFGRMLAQSAQAACAGRGWTVEATSLLIVGHGTRRDANSGATARDHAASIREAGGFGEVRVAFLDEAPRIPQVLKEISQPYCVAVGLFVDRGEHGEEDIPELLAPAGPSAAYAGPIGVDPAVAELILDQVRAADDGIRARTATGDETRRPCVDGGVGDGL